MEVPSPFWSSLSTSVKLRSRHSLVVQWLGFGAFTAGAQVQSLVRELRSHKPHDMAKKCWGVVCVAFSLYFWAIFWMRASCLVLGLHLCWDLSEAKWKWMSLSCVWLVAAPYSPWNSPGQNTGVGSLCLLKGIFLTQGSNPGLLHCRQILYQLSHKGRPRILE